MKLLRLLCLLLASTLPAFAAPDGEGTAFQGSPFITAGTGPVESYWKGEKDYPMMIPATAVWAIVADLSDPDQAKFGQQLITEALVPTVGLDSETRDSFASVQGRIRRIIVYGGTKNAAPGWNRPPVAILESGEAGFGQAVEGLLTARKKAKPGTVRFANIYSYVYAYQVRSSPDDREDPLIVGFPQDDRYVILSKSMKSLEGALIVPVWQRGLFFPETPPEHADVAARKLSEHSHHLVQAAFVSPGNLTADSGPNSQIMKGTKLANLFLDADGENVKVQLDLRAISGETASNVGQVIQGLLAMYSLSEHPSGDFAKVLSGTTVEVQGEIVSVRGQLPKEKLIELLRQGANPGQVGATFPAVQGGAGLTHNPLVLATRADSLGRTGSIAGPADRTP